MKKGIEILIVFLLAGALIAWIAVNALPSAPAMSGTTLAVTDEPIPTPIVTPPPPAQAPIRSTGG